MVTYKELEILYSCIKFSFNLGDSLKTNLQQIKKRSLPKFITD